MFPIDLLKSLRADLFTEACELNKVLDELCGLPLVDCHDSALRPISKILSDDIWTIVQSIRPISKILSDNIGMIVQPLATKTVSQGQF